MRYALWNPSLLFGAAQGSCLVLMGGPPTSHTTASQVPDTSIDPLSPCSPRAAANTGYWSLNSGDLHFERRCNAIGTEAEDIIEIQDIFRALKLHKIVISILQAISKESETASKMCGSLYDFLIAFCTKNPKNQVALYTEESLELFLRRKPANPVCDAGVWAQGHSYGTGHRAEGTGQRVERRGQSPEGTG